MATPAATEWRLWSTTARLVVTNGTKLRQATRIADRMLAQIDETCSRFRSDSELSRLAPLMPQGVEVSELLARFIRVALTAAEQTDGAVDPTLGYAMARSGYDRDIRLIEDDGELVRAVISERPGWKSVLLVGHHLRVPANLALDLGATAKAFAADLVSTTIARELRCGVLLSLGGDIATRGMEPARGWNVLVQDLPGDPAATIGMHSPGGLATSSVQKRTWHRAGDVMHHILDPRTGMPADPVWKTATVAAASAVRANTLSTAAIVRGERAPELLASAGVPARLVRADGTVLTLGGWPTELAVRSELATAV